MYVLLLLILQQKTDEQKSSYLFTLYNLTYKKDIVAVGKIDVLDNIANILASFIFLLNNSRKIYNTFNSAGLVNLYKATVISYIDFLLDFFLIKELSI